MSARACPRPQKGENVVGSDIRRLRKQAGLSQSYLLARLQILGWDIDRIVLSRIENGRRTLLDYELLYLLRALRKNWDDLSPVERKK